MKLLLVQVTSFAVVAGYLHIRLDGGKSSHKVHLGKQLRVSCDAAGLLSACELKHIDMTSLRVPLLSQRGPSEVRV